MERFVNRGCDSSEFSLCSWAPVLSVCVCGAWLLLEKFVYAGGIQLMITLFMRTCRLSRKVRCGTSISVSLAVLIDFRHLCN